MKTRIIVNFKLEGIHQWSGCPDLGEKQPVHLDVTFLRNPHRHVFHVCAKKTVSHDDRDIEIIQLKRTMERHFGAARIPVNLGDMSCEMLAKMYVKRYNLDYCSVLEDGENGAEVFADDKAIVDPLNDDDDDFEELTFKNLFEE